MGTCSEPGCKASPSGNAFRCDNHAETLLASVAESLAIVLTAASAIYLGRSSFPERRLLEHRARKGLDHMVVLHWCASHDEVAWLEEEFIAACRKYARLRNISGESEGRFTSPWNALYVTFTTKHGHRMDHRSWSKVAELHPSRRLWPDRGVVREPVPLYTPLTPGEAAETLREFKEQHRAVSRRGGR